jgi:predicted amidohydrolase
MARMDCRLCVAQTNPTLGDLRANLEDHLQRIDAAVGSADLILFPELSLTGYFLKDQVEELALTTDDPRLRPLLERSKRISIAFGFVERSREGAALQRARLPGGRTGPGGAPQGAPGDLRLFDEGRDFAAGSASA